MKYKFEYVRVADKLLIVLALLIIAVGIFSILHLSFEIVPGYLSLAALVGGSAALAYLLLSVNSTKKSARLAGNKLYSDGFTTSFNPKVIAEINSDPLKITGLRSGDTTYSYTYVVDFSEHRIYYFTLQVGEVVAALVETNNGEYYAYLNSSHKSPSI